MKKYRVYIQLPVKAISAKLYVDSCFESIVDNSIMEFEVKDSFSWLRENVISEDKFQVFVVYGTKKIELVPELVR